MKLLEIRVCREESGQWDELLGDRLSVRARGLGAEPASAHGKAWGGGGSEVRGVVVRLSLAHAAHSTSATYLQSLHCKNSKDGT